MFYTVSIRYVIDDVINLQIMGSEVDCISIFSKCQGKKVRREGVNCGSKKQNQAQVGFVIAFLCEQ